MKIGLSLSRCIRDIVEGRVEPESVLVIIARTDFDPNVEEQWKDIWEGYTGYSSRSAPEWRGLDEDTVLTCVMYLYNEGKIHQPRQFGAYPRRLPYNWLEVVLPSIELENNAAARLAFEQFKIVAGLSNVQLNDHRE